MKKKILTIIRVVGNSSMKQLDGLFNIMMILLTKVNECCLSILK